MLGYLSKMDRLTQLKEAQEAIDKQELFLSSTPDCQYNHSNESGPTKKPNTGLDEQARRNLDTWWRATPSTVPQGDVTGVFDVYNKLANLPRQRDLHNSRQPRNAHGPVQRPTPITNGVLNRTHQHPCHWTGLPPPGLNTLAGQYPPSLHRRISIAPEQHEPSACPGCRVERLTLCPDRRNHWPSCPWQKHVGGCYNG
jgi:hypothetical protein